MRLGYMAGSGSYPPPAIRRFTAGEQPIFGDLFDFGWKANQRNARILGDYLDNPRETVAGSRLFAWVLIRSLIGLFIVVGLLGYLLIYALWNSRQ